MLETSFSAPKTLKRLRSGPSAPCSTVLLTRSRRTVILRGARYATCVQLPIWATFSHVGACALPT
jgi:hypothetical protein